MRIHLVVPLLALFVLPFSSQAQKLKAGKANWQNLDLVEDGIQGISTEKAYRELLKNKKSTPVIVAVIDGGIEPDHEDLKSVMWVNRKEIAGDGLDDDGNGYIDDVHGWNFIGNSDGDNVQFDNLEIARLIRDLQPKYISVLPSTPLPEDEKKEFQKYQEMVAIYMEKLQRAQMGELNFRSLKELLDGITESIGKDNPTDQDFNNYKAKNKLETRALRVIKSGMKDGATYEEVYDEIKEGFDHYTNQVKYHLNMAYDSRGIVGDDYEDSNERFYGNNDIKGPDAFHGTHVAGIIGADRNNDLGIKGVADNVLIMGVRTVPDGDERDKDVANAIRYAVDNGAKVINMSFGKGYVKDKQVVDEAAKYAIANDVLLVQAAGNDGENIDVTLNYPNRYFVDSLGINQGEGEAWLMVGASSWDKSDIIASFSNYGKKSVDVFAPGVDIYSSAPDSKYKEASGTSMASPVVAGLAALIRSYYPKFSAPEVKKIIMESVVKIDDRVKVVDGRVSKKVHLNEISQTGGIVNAYNALKLAEERSKGK
jgi:subtilisin family serine protease